MDVLMASDENYVFLLGISLFSLFEVNKEIKEINTYVIADNIADESKAKIQDMAKKFNRKIEFIDPPKMSREIVVKGALNMSTYYRLKMASILPGNVEKILYLDCDTLIKGSLDSLWKIKLEDYLIAGVTDTTGKFARTSIGINRDADYVNAGVLLVNIRNWREENIEDQCMEFLKESKYQVEFNDQGIINKICYNRILLLNPKYNFMPPYERYSITNLSRIVEKKIDVTEEELNEAKDDPVIIHFAGYAFNRPWFENYNGKHLVEFNEVAKNSGFMNPAYKQPEGFKYKIRRFVNSMPDILCVVINRMIDEAYVLLQQKRK